ncbi:MAG: response regulator [Spirochaetes bacterium]|nr:response regulator [Spirochaetota bacterium]
MFEYLLKGGFLGICIILSFYHFIVWFGRKYDKSNLSYSLYTFALFFCVFNGQVYPEMDIYNKNLCLIGVIIASITMPVTITFFIFTIFNTKKIVKISKLYCFITIIIGLISLFFFCFTFNRMFVNISVFIIASLGIIVTSYIFYNIVKYKLYQSTKNKLVIAGLFFLLFSGFASAFATALEIEEVIFLVIFGPYLIMSFLFAISLASGFNKDHYALKKLSDNLEIQVKERTKELEQEKNLKTTFFINIAHEIKTPITLIKNFFEKYIRKMKKIDDDLIPVQTNINILSHTIQNFLTQETLNRGEIYYDHEQIINISDFFNNTLPLFKIMANKKEILIDSAIEQNLFTTADPIAINQIINNLIENAIKYTNQLGKINIILKSRNQKIFLDIKDTGIGMKKEQLKHIFNPYYQIKQEKQNIQGIGMGLSIVKGLLDQINGQIKIKSQSGEGTHITIILNSADSAEKLKESSYTVSETIIQANHSNSKKIDKNKKTILIVEDNHSMSEFISSLFIINYNILSASNGIEAIGLLNAFHADLIISDIMMDQMDGFSLVSLLKKEKAHLLIPVIFLTAKSTLEDKIKGLELGAIDYIEKPFNANELIFKVKNQFKLMDLITQNVHLHIKDEFSEIDLDQFYQKCQEHKLSEREIEVLQLMKFEKLSNKKIAERLDISVKSVETYLYNRIAIKIGLFSKKEILTYFS